MLQGESTIQDPRDRNGDFEPGAVPKHQSRGLSIERLVISLYAKGVNVSDIEDELRDIYGINLSGSGYLHYYEQGYAGCLGVAKSPSGTALHGCLDGRHRVQGTGIGQGASTRPFTCA